jgi:hypothetical protein
VRALAVLVLAPAFALGAVAGAAGIVGGKTEVERQPTSLVWANRIFVDQDDLAKWLESRGAAYEAWAARHPAAAESFSAGAERGAAAAPAKGQGTATDRSKPLLAGLAAAIVLAGLLVLFGRRDRRASIARKRTRRRPARVAVAQQPLRPMTNAGQLSASIRQHGQSAFSSVSPRLTSLASAAAARRVHLLDDLRDPYVRQRLRHLMPWIAFYIISAICALMLGASVAIYFQ